MIDGDLPGLVPGTTFTSSPRLLTHTDFVRYAGISGDFNPIHHDEACARAAGEPSVLGHGMLSAGLLATELTRRFGVGAVRGLRARFTRPVRPDEEVLGEFVVDTVDRTGDVVRVDLSCVLRTTAEPPEPTGVIVRGSARLELAVSGAAT